MLNWELLIQDRYPSIRKAHSFCSEKTGIHVFTFWCRCGQKVRCELTEIDLRVDDYFVRALIRQLDTHVERDQLEPIVKILWRILVNCTECLYEEVVDDTMKRFALLEF